MFKAKRNLFAGGKLFEKGELYSEVSKDIKQWFEEVKEEKKKKQEKKPDVRTR